MSNALPNYACNMLQHHQTSFVRLHQNVRTFDTTSLTVSGIRISEPNKYMKKLNFVGFLVNCRLDTPAKGFYLFLLEISRE